MARVGSRQGDASDADPAVARAQEGYALGPNDWTAIDASGTPDDTLARARAQVGTARHFEPRNLSSAGGGQASGWLQFGQQRGHRIAEAGKRCLRDMPDADIVDRRVTMDQHVAKSDDVANVRYPMRRGSGRLSTAGSALRR